MKNFGMYISKIIVFTYLSALAIQYIADYGLKNIENSIYADWNKIVEGTVSSDLLILGSSRGVVCYNTEIFEKTTGLSSFNLSFNAGAYNLQDIKYGLYLENNNKPKVLVQNIDLAHFELSKKLPGTYQFLPYHSYGFVNESFSDFDKDFNLYQYVPLLKYNRNKRYLVKGVASFLQINQTMPQTFNGYAPINIQFKKDNHNLERLKQMQKNNKENISALKKVKSRIEKQALDSIKVFVVWAPEFKDRLVYSNPLIADIRKEISAFAEKNPNVHFLDCSNDSMSLKKEYFYDTFHLNSLGANLFSKKVANQINNVLKE